ncbi:MAG: hypothetical protein E7015_02440 [Alphaproteobacteria bacterium]|nr:hypothetical protein [Alphaproteobacteria bacterium]
MNKIVAILGTIVLITLGALFFCAGFFTASTVPSQQLTEQAATKDEGHKPKDDIISSETIEAKLKEKSASISQKVMKILSSSVESFDSKKSTETTNEVNHPKLSTDALLKEIASSHFESDDCSIRKTEFNIQNPQRPHPLSLQGKTIAFIGYFKNNIALQVQRTLIGKGYKVHVEQSKNSPDESFVFCGPFKKVANATKLVNWLKQHSFSEAKVINVPEENLDALMPLITGSDDELPDNEEKDIPEVSREQMNALHYPQTAPYQQSMPMPPQNIASPMSQLSPQQQQALYQQRLMQQQMAQRQMQQMPPQQRAMYQQRLMQQSQAQQANHR